jgi:DNA-binding transcriptional ArsR family regulator
MQILEYAWGGDVAQELYEREAQLFSALSHPVRLHILDVLAQGEACVCHLSAVLQQRQAYVSQQLAKLKEAGLITDDKQGLYVYYRLAGPGNERVLHRARRCLVDLTGDESLLHVEVPAQGQLECSCPKCLARLSTASNTI